VEHHPSGREHSAEREEYREDGEACELEPHGGEEAKKGCEREPYSEGRERDDECVRDHAASL
jgi:hypothetical protein